MNIYKISLIEIELKENSVDFVDSFVIIADTEKSVRSLAADNCGDEGRDTWYVAADIEMIGKATMSVVHEQVVIRSFNAG